jgi:uncharacterized membrane protein YecN with MAPEG domain
MTTAIICTAMLAAMLLALGINVTRMRAVTGKTGGSQFTNDPASGLFKAIRAHGNAAEYVPVLIVLFLLVGARSPAAVAIPLIAGATVARLVHAYGLLSSPSLAAPTVSRSIGAVGTYLFGIGLAVAVVLSL